MKLLPKFGAALLGVLLVFLLAQPVAAATVNVSITSTGFVPESITVTQGDTVVWTNNDTTDHTATDDELNWDTDVIEPGETGSLVFNTVGSFTYSDTVDPTITGTITVEEGDVAEEDAAAATTTTTKGGTSPTPVPQPVSGVSGPTLSLMIVGGLMLTIGIASFRLL